MCFLLFATGLSGQDLDAFHWKNRVVLLFHADPAVPALERARDSISSANSSVEERDLVFITVGPERVEGPAGWEVSPGLAVRLRARYDIPETGFHWILIGKDGSEKARGEDSLPLEEIFSRIDRMPMRRAEMRRKGKG